MNNVLRTKNLFTGQIGERAREIRNIKNKDTI